MPSNSVKALEEGSRLVLDGADVWMDDQERMHIHVRGDDTLIRNCTFYGDVGLGGLVMSDQRMMMAFICDGTPPSEWPDAHVIVHTGGSP